MSNRNPDEADSKVEELQFSEIKIPVPWGHIAGRSLANKPSSKKVLMVHGIGHNCGSFKQLLHKFKRSYHIVAIDLPGHGHSSHFPPGVPLQFCDYVLSVRRVVDHLKWEKLYVVGHSFGGQLATYFTAMYPERVHAALVIDTMEPRPVLLEETLPHAQSTLNDLLRLEKKIEGRPRPTYTLEKAFEKVRKNTLWPLSANAAKDLMERGLVQLDEGFAFVTDQRLKNTMRPLLTFEQQMKILENIACPMLFVLGDQNMARYSTYLKSAFDFNRSRKNCYIVVVAGDHAVHQNHPERVSECLEQFLEAKQMPSNYMEMANSA